jgi:hypothetical protein
MSPIFPSRASRLGRGQATFSRARTTLQTVPNYAASPLRPFFVSSFCLRAAGLNRDLILRAPPRYSQVQMKTTAKLKKIYAHMMPIEC